MVPRLTLQTTGAVKTLVPISHRSSSFAVPVAISAAAKKKIVSSPAPAAPSGIQITPSLSSVLRPAAAQRWMLPNLANMTPQYVETLLRSAIAGSHVAVWELFDLMIDTDPEIHACVGEYNDGIMNKRLIVSPYREEDDEPSDLAIEKAKVVSAALRNMRPSVQSDENGLKATCRDIVSARFFGQSLLEIDWYDTYGDGQPFIKTFGDLGQVWCPRATYWVHPVCYAWSMTGRLGLRFGLADLQNITQQAQKNKMGAATLNDKTPAIVDPSLFNSISYQVKPANLTELLPNKFLVGVMKGKTGSPLSGSDLRCLAWWWVASNFCGDWLLNLAQLFGIPFRKASYSPGTQPNVVEEIKQMLAACGSAGYICLPEGAQVEFERASAGAAESPQGFLFHFADEQKRKVILRQTMTGGGTPGTLGKGGGQAFGTVEADCKAACIQNGADYAAEVFSLQLAPIILKMNYGEDGDSECPTVELTDEIEGGLQDAQRDVALAGIVDIPASFLYRKYNIPQPATGEPIAGVDTGKASPAHNPMLNGEADGYGPPEPPEQDQGQQDQGQQDDPEEEDDEDDDEEGDEPTGADSDPNEAHRALMARCSERQPDPIEAGGSTAEKGCLMAMVPNQLAAKLQSWAKAKIKSFTLTGDGLEDEPHVTVLYGFNVGTEQDKIAEAIINHGKAVATLGKISRFECPDNGYDVLKIDISSPDFENLNETLDSELASDISPSQYDYHPHLTLAYVKPGTNLSLDGSTVFQGQKFSVASLLYSEPGRANRSFLPLTKSMQAKLAKLSSNPGNDAVKAFDELTAPMRDRLEAIQKVTDRLTRVKLLQKFIADQNAMVNAMKKDDSLAQIVAAQVAASLAQGLKQGGRHV